jgi:hypothetical protein
MTIQFEWPELLILVIGWICVAAVGAWGKSKEEASMDVVPGSAMVQAPDMECVEGKVGFHR